MSEPDNISIFKQMTGLILGKLYSNHPVELQGEAHVFFGNTVPDDEEVDIFDSTVSYLVRCGYVHQDKQYFLQLTDKAWEAMQKKDPLAPSKSIGKSLSDWVKDASSDTAKDGLKKLAPVALTTLYKAITAIE